ncbi:hypothetical protein [Deinococcus hopiensis]|uniref:hypothetical protein n=1 Tax=Deinococcus hopiensis TaxID=309885 RepID=UPI001483658A|nr:hypothetical protein [Deinococcus hopiensis]
MRLGTAAPVACSRSRGSAPLPTLALRQVVRKVAEFCRIVQANDLARHEAGA